MTREEIQKLVNKGSVTQTGLLDSEKILKEDKETFAAHHINHPDVAEQFINANEEETPEVPPVVDPDPEEPAKSPEEVGADFSAALKTGGGDVVLEGDAAVEERMQVTKATNVDLGGNTITSTVNGKDALIVSGASSAVDVKIANGTFISEGTDDAYGVIAVQKSPALTLENLTVQGKNPVMVYSTGAPTITINSGEYTGTGAQAVYYYKGAGQLVINGGTFKSEPYEGKYYTLNIKDDQRAEDIRSQISVRGGKFYNFNPEDCISEGAGTDFVEPGYMVGSYDEGADKVYVVEKYDPNNESDFHIEGDHTIYWNNENARKRLGLTDSTSPSVDPKEEGNGDDFNF